jgi:hypothetical protein
MDEFGTISMLVDLAGIAAILATLFLPSIYSSYVNWRIRESFEK